MRKILKSYLKSFFKNWLSTLFIVLFLITLSTAIIGILTTPIQIYAKLLAAEQKTVKYNTQISLPTSTKVSYHSDVILEYMFEDETQNPLDSTTLNVLKYNLGVEKSVGQLQQSEREKITSYWNNVWSAYRSSSLMQLSFTAAEFDNTLGLKAQFKDIDNFKQHIFYQHLDKSLLEAQYEYQNLVNQNANVSDDQMMSILLGAIYRIYQFESANQITMTLDFNDYVKIITQLSTIDWMQISASEISKLTHSLFDYNKVQWDTTTNPQTKIYLLSYTFLKNSISQQLANPMFQHDDRIYFLFNFIDQLPGEYEMVASTEFSLKSGENLLGQQTSFDLKADANYILSNTQDKQFSSLTKVLFDDNVVKGSTHPGQWTESVSPQVVISSAYAKANHLSLGDTIELPSTSSAFSQIYQALSSALQLPETVETMFTQNVQATVVGVGQAFEDYAPGPSYSQYSQESKDYGVVYANVAYLQQYKNFEWKYKTSSEVSSTVYFKIRNLNNTPSLTANDFTITSNSNQQLLIFNDTSAMLTSWGDSAIDNTSTNLQIRIIIFIILSVVILILAFIFINFNIKKEINDTRKQLGIFKSLGYFTSELSWIFALKTFLLFFISIFIGFFVSMPFQQFAAQGFANTLTFYYATIYFSPWMFIAIVFGIPLIFLLIAFLFTLRDLNEHPLSLINNAKRKTPKVKDNMLLRLMVRKNVFFTWRLRRAFIKNSKGKFIVIQTLFAFASLSYILVFGAQTVSAKVINQGFSLYNRDVDHYYEWMRVYDKLNIENEQTKFDWADPTLTPINLQYLDYSKYKNSNAYLEHEVDPTTTAYRFRITALLQMMNNYYNQLDNAAKVQFLLPESELLYTLTHSFGLTLTNETPTNAPLSWFEVLFNYDLNASDVVTASLQVQSSGLTNQQINLTNFNPNTAQVTLKNINANQLSNFFYNDALELFGIKILQIITLYQQLPSILNNGVMFEDLITFIGSLATDDPVYFDYPAFVEHITASELITTFNPGVSTYWKNDQYNPLFNVLTPIITDKSTYTDQQLINLFFASDLSNLTSAISTALFMSDASNQMLFDKMININTIFFDKTNETLMQNMWFKYGEQANEVNLNTYLLSSQIEQYGDFRTMLNFDGVSNSQMNDFMNPQGETLVAIIPYYFHRNNNLNIGDEFVIRSRTSHIISIPVKVVGINSSETIKLGEDSIMLNKEQFETQYYSDNLQKTTMFSALYSKNAMLETEISLSNLLNAFNSTVNKDANMTLSLDSDAPVFTNIFNGVFQETSESDDLERIEKMSLNDVETIGLKAGVDQKNALYLINSYLKALFQHTTNVEPSLETDYTVSFDDNAFDENGLLKAGVNVTISATPTSRFFTPNSSKKISVLSVDATLPTIMTKQSLQLLTNPSFFTQYWTSSTPLNILKATINLALDIADKIMIVFVLLSTIILSIILLVVIGIVVDEAKATILTMKALGYKAIKVNWLIIGSYLIGLIISFVFAFILSIIIWKIVLYWVSLEFGVYIFLGIDYRSAYITAPIILFVLLVGWYAADKQVRKIPLTQITSMT